MSEMQYVMKMFRFGFSALGGLIVESILDRSREADGYYDVEYRLAGGSSVEIHAENQSPLTVSVSIAADSEDKAAETEKLIRTDIENIIYIDQRAGYCCE